jgi:ubiquinol-cytochrome c reductase cytochrome c subunit
VIFTGEVTAPAQAPSAKPSLFQRARAGHGRLADARIRGGRQVFLVDCSHCHGLNGQGIHGKAPSLRGVGARAADFYLSTGRMPMRGPRDEPVRRKPKYQARDVEALIAYVASLGRGPGIPRAHPDRGSLREGLEAFTSHCAGCHQVVGGGGIVTGARVPSLRDATPTQIAEAVRIGPYVMPKFSKRQISDTELDSIIKYVLYTRDPRDEGGWPLGRLGPIPEGIVAWFLAGLALVLAARAIGGGLRRD